MKVSQASIFRIFRLEHHLTPNKVAARDALLKRTGLAPESTEFVTAALDPFHDRKVDFDGVPDQTVDASISQCIKEAATISKPTAGAGTWRFVAFTTPLDRPAELQACADHIAPINGQYSASLVSAGTTVNVGIGATQQKGAAVVDAGNPSTGDFDGYFHLGWLNIWSWNDESHTDFFPQGVNGGDWVPPDAITVFSILGRDATTSLLGITNEASNLLYRVVSSGFELTNSTASLYKQGMLTAVRVSTEPDLSEKFVVAAQRNPFLHTGNGIASVFGLKYDNYACFQLPPANVGQALKAGGIQHSAAKGSYSIDAYDYEENEFTKETSRHISAQSSEPWVYSTSGFANPTLSQNTTSLSSLNLNSVLAIENPSQSFYFAKMAPITHLSSRDCVAVYATGLSAETTFNVGTAAYVQMAPRLSNKEYSALVPLKKAPLAYDPQALLLAQAGQRHLPPMVPVGDNEKGDFWKGIFDTAFTSLKLAAPIIGGIFTDDPAMMAEGTKNIVKTILNKANATQGRVAKLEKTTQKVAGQAGGNKAALERTHAIRRQKPKAKRRPARFRTVK